MKRFLAIAGLFLWCLSFGAAAQQSRSISGTLFWKDGTPATGVRVAAAEVAVAGRGANGSLAAVVQTDSAGRFRLEAVPIGSYRIIAGPFDAPTYYPGTATEAEAKLVELGNGATATGIDFRMTTIHFTGRVLWQDASNPDRTTIVPGKDLSAPPVTQVTLSGSKGGPRITAAVTPDGRFEFTALRPDRYRIALTPAETQGPERSVTIADQDIVDYPIIRPYIVTVTGTVTTDEDYVPSPNFQLVFSDPNKPPPELKDTLATMLGGQVVQFVGIYDPRTDLVTAQVAGLIYARVPTGRYRVTVLGLDGHYQVQSITAGDLDLKSNPMTVSAVGLPPIRIALKTAGTPYTATIRGRISGRGLLSIANFAVYGPTRALTYGVSFSSDRSAELIFNSSRPATVFFLDGSFEASHLPPGQYSISVGSSTVGPNPPKYDVTNGDVNDLVITVPDAEPVRPVGAAAVADGPRVRGKIVGHARAVPGASVRLLEKAGTSLSTPIYMDGSFEFPHVPSGIYQATVTPRIPGAVPEILNVGPADLDGVVIRVPSTFEIAGRVLVENDGPIPSVLRFNVADMELRTTLQPDGKFVLTAPEGQQLTVAPDSLPAGYSVVSLTVETKVVLTLRSPAAASVKGRVRTKESGRLWLTDKAGLLRTVESVSDPSAAFEFSKVMPGTYTLRFIAPNTSANRETTITVTSGQNLEGIEL